jgi:hypothetical protein
MFHLYLPNEAWIALKNGEIDATVAYAIPADGRDFESGFYIATQVNVAFDKMHENYTLNDIGDSVVHVYEIAENKLALTNSILFDYGVDRREPLDSDITNYLYVIASDILYGDASRPMQLQRLAKTLQDRGHYQGESLSPNRGWYKTASAACLNR